MATKEVQRRAGPGVYPISTYPRKGYAYRVIGFDRDGFAVENRDCADYDDTYRIRHTFFKDNLHINLVRLYDRHGELISTRTRLEWEVVQSVT